jgi:hypothetical protein
MMMEESAINLEVDLSSLGLDEKIEVCVKKGSYPGFSCRKYNMETRSIETDLLQSPDELEEEQQEFVWDRCLNDQMFVFQEHELDNILSIIITNMTPQRSPSQKPIPANLLFLSARFAHYYANPELLAKLLVSATDRINDVVERSQWDMTVLAFWVSNATLLLHYLKKDPGLMEATVEFQLHLAELINEIFILIIRDAERRMNRVLDGAMLDHETIPGFEDVHFQHEWKIFRPKTKSKPPEPLEKRLRPPSPKRRAKISPRNITSLLSSTLFVLDLYDVHSVITTQIVSQLLYWLGAELFNRIMSTKKYLARTKAMQIRMNVSVLEDWARSNNRQPEHYENGSRTTSGESTVDSARRHLAPVIQLLQWLQCFSSLGDDSEALVTTLLQLQQLTPNQLIHAVKQYRPEVGEKGLTKNAMAFLLELRHDPDLLFRRQQQLQTPRSHTPVPALPSHTDRTATDHSSPTRHGSSAPTGLLDGSAAKDSLSTAAPEPPAESQPASAEETTGQPSSMSLPSAAVPAASAMRNTSGLPPGTVQLDPSLTLPFFLPTSMDMLISYGAGVGGANKDRARKYIPTVPTEVLGRFDRS